MRKAGTELISSGLRKNEKNEIYRKLIGKNKESFKEIFLGEEAYLDLFKEDEDTFA